MFAGYATGQRIVTFSLSSLPLDIIIDKFPRWTDFVNKYQVPLITGNINFKNKK